MADEVTIRHLVEAELVKIADPARKAALTAVLVQPQPVSLGWDYGSPGERHRCWIVGESPFLKVRLIFCDKGFGPSDPWGIVGTQDQQMGMDCQWYVGLEHAAIGAGILNAPPKYEVP